MKSKEKRAIFNDIRDSTYWYESTHINTLRNIENNKGDSRFCWCTPLSSDLIYRYLPDIIAEAKQSNKILLPLNTGSLSNGGEHWVGIVFEIKADSQVDVQYLDSLSSDPQAKAPLSLQKIIKKSLETAENPMKVEFVFPNFEVATQGDFSSCGAYMMHNLRQAVTGKTAQIIPNALQLRAADFEAIERYNEQEKLNEEKRVKRIEAEQRIEEANRRPKEYKRELHCKATVQRITEQIINERKRKIEPRIEREKERAAVYLAGLSEDKRKAGEERLKRSEKRAKAADLREEIKQRENIIQNYLRLPSQAKPKNTLNRP